MKQILPVLFIIVSIHSPCFAVGAGTIALDDAAALRIGKMIWQNECGGTVEGLTMWNKGEEFPSLGIGHFIWYPTGTSGPYQESFPGLLSFLRQNGIELPAWLDQAQGCPWPNREAFQADFHGARLSGLRKLLESTVTLQARFAAQRFQEALPKLVAAAPEQDRPAIEQRFALVAAHPNGLYALMDYVNFKGEGTNPSERYQGEGWGLLQVLTAMRPAQTPSEAVNAFSDAAIAVLARRVELSPPHRNEGRWTKGWNARCRSYRSDASIN